MGYYGESEIKADDTKCYIRTPYTTEGGEVLWFEGRTIITKEVFVKCYERWIKNKEGDADDNT